MNAVKLEIGAHVDLSHGDMTARKTVSEVSDNGRRLVLMDDPEMIEGETGVFVSQDGVGWTVEGGAAEMVMTIKVAQDGNEQWKDDYVPCEKCEQAVLEYPCWNCGHTGE